MTPERDQHGAPLTAASTTAAVPDSKLVAEASARLAHHGPLDDARFAPGHIFASRYRIVSLLGRGAMGEVYRADDLKLGQPVAIKLLASSGARTGLVERSVSEVRLARTIAHPNVCRVYDLGEADGWWYLSMELVDGETLRSLLRRIGRLPAEKALDIARQLCAGLAAAHDRGVLHRDLKPSNIMIDGRGRIRIMDFGLAVPSGDWTIGEIAGTPAYMSPEQIAGDRATERTDLYSLGLVLYELYTGRRLLAVQTFEERERLSDDAPLAPFLPGIDAEVQRVIHSCLERNPEQRPESAGAIAARLPGGDPLAAAIANGALPSPEIVAAAGPKGALRPAAAWAMLGAIMIGILAVASQAHVANVAPSDLPKPPEALAERARTILAAIGASAAVDSAFWFEVNPERNDRRRGLAFVFRQSPVHLVPQNLFHMVTADDPPANVLGMATIRLDPSGRLLGFTRLRPANVPPAKSMTPTDWASVFREAGLDIEGFAPTEPRHTPQLPHDTRFEWSQSSAAEGRRITAATLQGEPVQFGVTESDSSNTVTARPPLGTGSPATDLAIWILIVSVFAGSAVLARYNLRRGQGDRTGAKRLVMCAVFLGVMSVILRPHHVPMAVEEITYLFAATGWVLAWGGLTWLVYISLEPYLRRRWPRTLISWNRLLAGRVRDPLVGRDVLIGMLAGVVRLLFVLVPISTGAAAAYSPTTLESLQSVPRFLNVVLPFQVAYSLVGALAAAFVLVVITLIVRKTWIAVSLAILIAIPLSSVAFGWPLIFVLAAPLLTYVVFLRAGLVAFIATYLVDVLFRVPVTLDPSAWYFGNSLVVLLGLAALATGAFVISLGGRPAFGSSPA